MISTFAAALQDHMQRYIHVHAVVGQRTPAHLPRERRCACHAGYAAARLRRRRRVQPSGRGGSQPGGSGACAAPSGPAGASGAAERAGAGGALPALCAQVPCGANRCGCMDAAAAARCKPRMTLPGMAVQCVMHDHALPGVAVQPVCGLAAVQQIALPSLAVPWGFAASTVSLLNPAGLACHPASARHQLCCELLSCSLLAPSIMLLKPSPGVPAVMCTAEPESGLPGVGSSGMAWPKQEGMRCPCRSLHHYSITSLETSMDVASQSSSHPTSSPLGGTHAAPCCRWRAAADDAPAVKPPCLSLRSRNVCGPLRTNPSSPNASRLPTLGLLPQARCAGLPRLLGVG